MKEPYNILAVFNPKFVDFYQCHKLPPRFENPNGEALELGIPKRTGRKIPVNGFLAETLTDISQGSGQ